MKKSSWIILAVLGLWIYVWHFHGQRVPDQSEQTFSSWSRDVASPAPAQSASRLAPNPSQSETVAVRKARSRRQNLDARLAALSVGKEAPPPWRSLQHGQVQTINEQPYQILAAMAVHRDVYQPSMGDVLAEQGHYRFLAVTSDNWQEAKLLRDSRPVLVSAASGRLAVVTGTLVVTFKSLDAVESLAKQENYRVLKVDEGLRTVYFQAPTGYAMLEGLARVQGQPEVQRAELELDRGHKVAK